MKNEKHKSREPFPPEKTPVQPDHAPENKVKDPSLKQERGEPDEPMKMRPDKNTSKPQKKEKTQGEPESGKQ